MLSILTAAETEMYESSKKQEESQQMQKSGTIKPPMKDAEASVALLDSAEFANLEKQYKDLKNQTAKDSKQSTLLQARIQEENEALQEDNE